MKLRLAVVFFAVLSLNIFADIKWDGRFYEHVMVFFKENNNHIISKYFGLSILDLKQDVRPSDILRIRGELEFAFTHQTNAGLIGTSEPVVINSLNATITPDKFKITIGRFLPRWGVCKIFRPLDVFTPQLYFLNDLSFKGIDGVSTKYYISELSSLELIVVPSMDVWQTGLLTTTISTSSSKPAEIRHTVLAANTEVHIGTFDNNIIFLYDTFSVNKVLGFAFKGDIILGISGELYYRFKNKNSRNIFKSSIGLDYSFAKYFFVSAEYFYDESGVKNFQDYPLLAAVESRMTFGRQYFTVDFNILTYTEINYGLSGIVNLLDKSLIIFPYFRHEILNNCILGISLYHFNGASGREFSPALTGNFIFNTYLLVRF